MRIDRLSRELRDGLRTHHRGDTAAFLPRELFSGKRVCQALHRPHAHAADFYASSFWLRARFVATLSRLIERNMTTSKSLYLDSVILSVGIFEEREESTSEKNF